MRTSLLPGLLTVVSTNSGRQQSRVALFEIGAVYLPESGDLLAQPREPRRLGIVLYGQRHDRNWAVPVRNTISTMSRESWRVSWLGRISFGLRDRVLRSIPSVKERLVQGAARCCLW